MYLFANYRFMILKKTLISISIHKNAGAEATGTAAKEAATKGEVAEREQQPKEK